MLLSAQGQTVWVVPRAVPTAGGANGRAVDLEAPSTLSGPAVQDWKTALLNVRPLPNMELGVSGGAEGGGAEGGRGCGAYDRLRYDFVLC